MSGQEKYSLPFKHEENVQLLMKDDKCDKYDYLLATACGALGGMIDIFLVGAPGESKLSKWTDTQTDNVVMSFARKMGWTPRQGQEHNVKSAIGFLENGSGKSNFNGFKVNYDHKNSVEVQDLFKMSPKNHHMKSLAHSPDPIGLFFSILNQFTNTSTFINNGKLITIPTETYELQGGNFIAKIFCGVANWFGHLMSDVAGSSGAKGRGSGIVMPFYELFGLCNFGKFKGGEDLSILATKAFEQGYDFRFGLSQSIPVVITDLTIRLIWSLRRHFQYGKPLNECIPSTNKHSTLRVMLLFGQGTLCVMDGIDAFIRSGGNPIMFFTRMNLVAWFRFAVLVFKEICIRIGIKAPLQKTIDAFKRINEGLCIYLKELETIDIELFKKETREYNKLVSGFDKVQSESQLSLMLEDALEKSGIQKPWQGDFDDFMLNDDSSLVFK